jgi:hypothetical protein
MTLFLCHPYHGAEKPNHCLPHQGKSGNNYQALVVVNNIIIFYINVFFIMKHLHSFI